MSRSGFRAALNAVTFLGLVLVAGCGGRPSAHDYAVYEAALRTTGKLRTETAPVGAPYTAADLVRNFERIALRHEADATVAGGEENSNPNPLIRWHGPLNYGLFGNAVTPADRFEATRLMDRIALLTGLEITEAEDEVNFLILITSPEEREDTSAHLAKLSPALSDTFDFWRRSPEVICVANNLFDGDDGNLIVAGLAVIGSETSGILRRACLHEEIVQALGLANDHPDVRPSIFNDDGEFALLTEHDEHLLRILYDPRLKPGMTAEEAMPLVRRIVAGIPLNRPSANLAEGAAAMVPVAQYRDPRPPTTQNASRN
jgi:hypothetical protein